MIGYAPASPGMNQAAQSIGTSADPQVILNDAISEIYNPVGTCQGRIGLATGTMLQRACVAPNTMASYPPAVMTPQPAPLIYGTPEDRAYLVAVVPLLERPVPRWQFWVGIGAAAAAVGLLSLRARGVKLQLSVK